MVECFGFYNGHICNAEDHGRADPDTVCRISVLKINVDGVFLQKMTGSLANAYAESRSELHQHHIILSCIMRRAAAVCIDIADGAVHVNDIHENADQQPTVLSVIRHFRSRLGICRLQS